MLPFLVRSPFSGRRGSSPRGAALTWMAGGLLAVMLLAGPLSAQELVHRRHPLSVYLDLRPTTSTDATQNTPPWIEALEFTAGDPTAAMAEGATETTEGIQRNRRGVFRIRLHRPDTNLSEQLQARVFFQDSATGNRPQVTVWNELGERLMAPASLGQGLDLPSSETLTLPMHGADYIEIAADTDGSQVRAVFLSWLETAEMLQPTDFRSRDTVKQPFRILPATRPRKNDSSLYGVVTASLQDDKPLVLKPTENRTADFQFSLERQPLLAVVTYEVLGVPTDAPPSVTMNGRAQGNSSLYLPDLADPGFQGVAREAERQVAFRYTGWLHAQKIIPGDALTTGLNNLSLGLSNGTDAIAVRAVSIQLKYNWEKLDYVLAPAPSSNHEDP